ncbi:ATP-dependent helicase [Ferroacidibacillus organovorans]|uniref:ATP-dependent helicase n=1 Tax=Ferroacidibacillus organovorans TaxID=1765683 RepID=UPI0015C43FF4|nr:ATP-dependent helicase [Ferroacidibacillus organovorans]
MSDELSACKRLSRRGEVSDESFFAELKGKGIDITETQKSAIRHPSGALALFAGPGSGKTTVITLRAAYLVRVLNEDPNSISIFTFTKKSADELTRRLQQIHPTLKSVQTGTFHALYLKWLLREAKERRELLTGYAQRGVVRSILQSLREPFHDDQVTAILQAITVLKNQMVEPVNAKDHLDTRDVPASTATVYQQYESYKKENNVWDFDDILMVMNERLHSQPSFYTSCTDSIRHIMVDEFQDTSRIQWNSLLKLASKTVSFMVVGDDDQSIYAFRGAEPGLMKTFVHARPHVRELVLSENFRSLDPIIRTASRLIQMNEDRKPKLMRGVRGTGERVRVLRAKNAMEEGRVIATAIAKIHARDPLRTVGILARSHHHLYLVSEQLRTQGIALVEDLGKNLYTESVVASYLALFRVSCGDFRVREEAFRFYLKLLEPRVAREQAGLLGGRAALYQHMAGTPTTLAFDAFVKNMAVQTPLDAVRLLTKHYEAYTVRLEHARRTPSQEARQALQLLEDRVAGLPDLKTFILEVDRFSQKDEQGLSKAQVRVMTFHGAKGLEFDDVILAGVYDGAVPHARALTGERKARRVLLEEERRLFYVALTRARDRLFVVYPASTANADREPSPFLFDAGLLSRKDENRKSIHTKDREKQVRVKSDRQIVTRHDKRSTVVRKAAFHTPIPVTADQLPKRGEPIHHEVFGEGVVLSIDPFPNGHKVAIQFKESDVRHLFWEVALSEGHVRKP